MPNRDPQLRRYWRSAAARASLVRSAVADHFTPVLAPGQDRRSPVEPPTNPALARRGAANGRALPAQDGKAKDVR